MAWFHPPFAAVTTDLATAEFAKVGNKAATETAVGGWVGSRNGLENKEVQ